MPEPSAKEPGKEEPNAMADYNTVRVDQSGGVVTLTLNKPDKICLLYTSDAADE